ncbi:MAG: zinc metallopeptidase [Eubacteriaceae bacterium]|nr:zinc metallopeptidase [Eubacteriaceae bacterium]
MFYPRYYYFDPTYLVLLPAIIISLVAQIKVSSSYSKYSKMRNSRGITGIEAARRILYANGLGDVQIQVISGNLSDHYDPTRRVLRLSGDVANSTSIASIAVAAHECGHAIQHATGYSPLKLRSAIVPVANIASSLSWVLLVMGIIFASDSLVTIGIVAFVGYVLFHVVTLPVEFNASSRALAQIEGLGLSTADEIHHEKKMLSACALTYISAAIMAVLQLLRLILIARSRDRD